MTDSFAFWLPTIGVIAGPFILAAVLMTVTTPPKS
jgi:hypothetical protein